VSGSHPYLQVENFDYVRVGERLAVVRLVARVNNELRVPVDASLVIEGDLNSTWTEARRCVLERRRRLITPSPLLWTARFGLPLEIIESHSAVFELVAPGQPPLSLPLPGLRVLTAAEAMAERHWLMSSAHVARKAAATATALAVLGGSTPAFALAAEGGSTAHVSRGHRKSLVVKSGSKQSAHTAPLHASSAAQTAIHQLAATPATGGGSGTAHKVARSHPGASGSAPTGHKVSNPHPGAKGHAGTPEHKVSHPHAGAKGHSGTPEHKAPHPHPHAGAKGHSGAPEHKAPHPHAGAKAHAGAPEPESSHPSAGGNRHSGSPHKVSSRSGGVSLTPPKPVTSPPAAGHKHHKATSTPAPVALTPVPATSSLSPTMPARDGSLPVSALSALSKLFANGHQPPSFLIPIFKAAGRKYHVPWRVLAAINSIETDYGRNLNTSGAGAIGWMQFMPSTWKEYGVSVLSRRMPNPYDPQDAIFSAARYLAANGARHNLRTAIFAYNHAEWYVDEVLALSVTIQDTRLHRGTEAGRKVDAMFRTALSLDGKPYVWGGGHGGWEPSAGYDCSGFVSAVLHSAGYLEAPVTTNALPSASGIEAGPGQFVTIFDRTDPSLGQGHVIIDIGGQWWESGGSNTDGGSASVHRINNMSVAYLATFNEILHPRGL
jgi:cell wall-associated NlpC family hydrolase